MPKVTKKICGTEYTFDNIRIGDARRMKRDYADNSDYNVAFIAASLHAGGMEDATPEWVDANLPFFDGAFTEFLKAAYEACGMKLEVPESEKAGEGKPALEPASSDEANPDSTSSTSMEPSDAGSATE